MGKGPMCISKIFYKDHTLVPVMDHQAELLYPEMSSANPAGLAQSPYIPGMTHVLPATLHRQDN